MIARHWKGIFKPEEAANYTNHLLDETFVHLSEIEGFMRASILGGSVNEGVEFLIITIWQSMKAIQQFAGETAEIAVVPEKVQAMTIEYDKQIIHYEIAEDFPR